MEDGLMFSVLREEAIYLVKHQLRDRAVLRARVFTPDSTAEVHSPPFHPLSCDAHRRDATGWVSVGQQERKFQGSRVFAPVDDRFREREACESCFAREGVASQQLQLQLCPSSNTRGRGAEARVVLSQAYALSFTP